MQKTRFSRHVVAVLFILSAAGTLADDAIEEIVVTADFRGREAAELPASISVFDAEFLRGASVQHFEELINIVPNLNWSGDGHRARYSRALFPDPRRRRTGTVRRCAEPVGRVPAGRHRLQRHWCDRDAL